MRLNYARQFTVLLALLLLSAVYAEAQMTKIMGKVTDATTKEPIPFVNLILKGTTVGNITDFNGEYSIETRQSSDSLVATFMGYRKVSKKVVRGRFQTIDFELVPNELSLKEVVITPGVNPAEVILKNIIASKPDNDREKLDFYQYEAYNKVQFDANNISEKFKNRRIFRPFKFIFENVDTSTINGKAYLPIFLSEALSDVYFRKEPKTQIEVIKASKISGIENTSFSQFLGDIVQNINIYDNYLSIFQKNFVSPVANFGLGYYKYYLVDSTFIDNKWCYQIVFKPRRKQELTFTGNFWVTDTTWAIRKVDMKVADDANINFINGLVISQEYKPVDGTHWMLTRDYLVGDFNLFENEKVTMGFYGRKTTTYDKFVINQPREREFYNSPTSIIVKDDATKKPDEYWENNRQDSLTKGEKKIYHMIDTLESLPLFTTYVDIVKTLTMGYYIKGNIEWGPIMALYSFNSLEGNRFRVGGRTSNAFSTKWMLDAHVAYGTKDDKFKYGGGFLYMVNKNPRRTLGGSFKYDIEQLGQSQNAFMEDHFLTSVFRRNPADRLSMVQEMKVTYDHEWFTGLSNTFQFIHRDINALGNAQFQVIPDMHDTIDKKEFTTSEVALSMRFAYRERFVSGEFERISLGAKYPVVQLRYGYGIKNFWNGEYEYHRLQLNIEHWFNIGAFGWSKYIIEAGKIWDRNPIPYPLLKIHEGNETYIFDEYAFNMMNYYEFVSDKYVSAYYTHHFLGFFLNKIPLMRRLKWREVAWVKGVVGSTSSVNWNYAPPEKDKIFTLGKPYVDCGVGVENILKFIRVDAMWRLSYLDHPRAVPFAVMFSLWFDF